MVPSFPFSLPPLPPVSPKSGPISQKQNIENLFVMGGGSAEKKGPAEERSDPFSTRRPPERGLALEGVVRGPGPG